MLLFQTHYTNIIRVHKHTWVYDQKHNFTAVAADMYNSDYLSDWFRSVRLVLVHECAGRGFVVSRLRGGDRPQ